MTNRLAKAQSLYLRKHAENPIDWWDWCDEALEKAQQENKPIFLSIGYSSCHWCTVMEGEAFSDRAIAQYMNANFLPIKVDREERPDIDSIYMQALQMMTGQGGWPLNIFLTPGDRIPFYGGTYFSVEPRYGRPGFLQVLQSIRRFYDTEKAKLANFKEEILGTLQQAAILPGTDELENELHVIGAETCARILSSKSGGPSFPMIPYAEMALRGSRFNVGLANDAKNACRQRGYDLALGGIYDHVAGGFHRYTVDPTWTVPHFEKMLYDNGQIIEYLVDLWTAGIKEPAFQRAIEGTVAWLQREMTSPQGYFYAAQDADSFTSPAAQEPEEGSFYVWTYGELSEILTPEELAEMQQQFTVTSGGNFEGKNVLQRTQLGKLSDSLETALRKLFAVRYGAAPEEIKTFPPARNNEEAKTGNWPGRIPAVTDPKMIVAWNSLTISGLAKAASLFGRAEYLELATGAANFILENQWVDGRLYRVNYEGTAAVLAQSEDYALLIKALLDLHACDRANGSWLIHAIAVQSEFDDFLWSLQLGGYYNTANDASDDLIVRERSYGDNATPAANGVAIGNLVRLTLLTENLEYLDRAEEGLKAFSAIMNQAPQACPSLFAALDWYHNQTLVRTKKDQIEILSNQYLPTAEFNLATELPGDVVGLVCQGLKCKAPARSQEMLIDQLEKSQIRSVSNP
ncbi:MAG: thioredoxin domain-containing protein [Hormoscilla sp. GM7CHS1pb]|nr:thioredoxin domain-containing protein [Hormoscilla sp. GM7CHS1pb]